MATVAVLVATTLAWVVSFALAAGLVAWQGRLLFPALPGIATLLAIGLGAWASLGIRNGQTTTRLSFFSRTMPLLVAGAMLLAAVWLAFGVIRPAYPAQTVPETAALARLGTPVYGRFAPQGEQGAALRGWSVSGEAQPGATLEIQLMWQALARQSRSWAVFVHLVDGQEQIVAQSNSFPRKGLFPTTQWDAGDWVEDTHSLELPESLPPGGYTLRLGLFDQGGTQERTGVYSQDGELLGDYLELATITVQPAASR